MRPYGLQLIPMCFLLAYGFGFGQTVSSSVNAKFWHDEKIKVCWEKSEVSYAEEKEWVKSIITHTWQQESRLMFTDWCDCTSKSTGIRIKIDDTRPRTRFLGHDLNGQPGGVILNFKFRRWKPTLPVYVKEKNVTEYRKVDVKDNVSRRRIIEQIALHEFGHVLGFTHQQSRKDCNFYRCPFIEDSPIEGGWFTPCDRFSVMNYCNPAYSNNGMLSEYDKKTLQQLYGKPSKQAADDPSLTLIYTFNLSDGFKKITIKNPPTSQEPPETTLNYRTYQVKVFLAGEKKAMQAVNKVVYQLHPTFSPSQKESSSASDRFGIVLSEVWGNFQIKATVLRKDGSTFQPDDIDIQLPVEYLERKGIPIPQFFRPGRGKDASLNPPGQ